MKDVFSEIAVYLTPKMRVIIPDLPGFGATDRRPGDDYSIVKQAERMHMFIKKLGLNSVHIGGNSLGGWIAGVFAANYPNSTDSLWLLNPSGTISGKKSYVLSHFDKTDEILLVTRSEEDFDRSMNIVFKNQPVFIRLLPGFVRRAIARDAMKDMDFNDRMFRDLWKLDYDLGERLAASSYRKPVLLVWGDSDKVLHVDGAQEFMRFVPWAKCIIMKDMGHAPMNERPKETAADYLKFRNLVG